MSSNNPYQPPATHRDVTDRVEPANEADSIGFAFESDWSTDGLKTRRRHPMHGPADLGFVILSIVCLLAGMAALGGSRVAGIFCLLTPMWGIAGMMWVSSWVFRNGGRFATVCRPLSGPIRGRVEAGIVSFRGPSMAISTRTDRCQHSNWTARGAVFRPPLVPDLLPIIEDDIRETWECATALPGEEGLFTRTLETIGIDSTTPRASGSGTLLGSDFRGQRRWQTWAVLGSLCVAIGSFGLIWVAYSFWNLPDWVRHPPSHYERSDAESRAGWLLFLSLFLFGAAVGWGVWWLTRTTASYGRYRIVVTADALVIANDDYAAAYYGDALGNFVVSGHGVAVRLPSGRTEFMIPLRWFDSSDHGQIEQWLASWVHDRPAIAYLGPRV